MFAEIIETGGTVADATARALELRQQWLSEDEVPHTFRVVRMLFFLWTALCFTAFMGLATQMVDVSDVGLAALAIWMVGVLVGTAVSGVAAIVHFVSAAISLP